MKRTVITNGLIAGIIVSVFMTISMLICKYNPNWEATSYSMLVGYLSMLIAFSMIYVGVKSFRDNYQDGSISFGKAFRIGLGITLIASTLYVVSWALVYHFVMPDFMDNYANNMLKRAATSATAAELQQKAAEMANMKEMYKNPVFFALFTYAEILPVGVVVSLIVALILKRRKEVLVAA